MSFGITLNVEDFFSTCEYTCSARSPLRGRARALADAYWTGRWLSVGKLRSKTLHVAGKRLSFTHNFIEADRQLREIFMGEYEAPRLSPRNIIDAGSNNGSSVLWFKLMYPESRIMAFEPFPRTAECLKHNVSVNGFDESVEVNALALSDKAGIQEFHYYEDQGASNSIYSNGSHGRTTEIVATRLSEHLSACDLLKLDIEGSEGPVLRELESSGKLELVREIIMEYHPYGPVSLSDILKLLERNSYITDLKSKVSMPFSTTPERLLIRAWRK